MERRRARLRGKTLAEAFEDFLKHRELKPRTRYEYTRLMETVFRDWQGKSIAEIDRTMVASRHKRTGETNGEARANLALRFLRSLLAFAQATYDDGSGRALLTENPVAVLTQTRAWYRSKRRTTVIKAHQLPAWYEAVMALKAPSGSDFDATVADYLLLILFTGLRRQEAATLTWDNVDLTDATLHIPDPKNHEPLTLPVSDFILKQLRARHEQAVNGYVFANRDGSGYLTDARP